METAANFATFRATWNTFILRHVLYGKLNKIDYFTIYRGNSRKGGEGENKGINILSIKKEEEKK